MRRALFFVYLDTHFVELCRLAIRLKDAGGWECVFQFAYRYPARARDLEICRERGFGSVDGMGNPLEHESEPPLSPPSAPASVRPQLSARLFRLLREPGQARLRAIAAAFLSQLRRGSPVDFLQSLVFPRVSVFLAVYLEYQKQAESVMARFRPDILILPEDNVAYPTGALIRAAKAMGTPSLIVPYTIANAEEIAEAYWDNPDYWLKPWRNRLVGRLYPAWVHEHKDRKLLPLPPDQILVIERLGLAPPLPWVINSGAADGLAVESPFMLRYYLAAGLPRGRMTVTGTLADDVLFRRMEVLSSGAPGADPSTSLARRPVLLCALPPDQFRSRRRAAEFDSYEALVRAWAAELAAVRRFEVMVRLHPRTLKEDVPYLENEYGLRVVSEDTATLVPGCDVFLASVSATIRMAIAAGKPVINYDCYRYCYSDFAGVPGVLNVEDREAFRATLRRLEDPGTRGEFATRQREFAAKEFPLDGRSGERLLALIAALVAQGASGQHPDRSQSSIVESTSR